MHAGAPGATAAHSTFVLFRADLLTLRTRASASRLVLGPGHEPRLQPGEARGHQNSGDRQHDHAREQIRHIEGIRGRGDQPSEACARAEQLRHHYADQPAADPSLSPARMNGTADGSETLKKSARVAPNERSISISRSLVVRSPASVLIATGKTPGGPRSAPSTRCRSRTTG